MAIMQSRYDELVKNDTWYLTNFPANKKVIGTKWDYKLKCKVDGSIDCYKERFIAKGYAQEKGIHHDETFSSTCCMTNICSIYALIAHFDLHVHQLDIKISFLNGNLHGEVYVSQPHGFVQKG